MSKYPIVIIYTKKGDLLPYFNHKLASALRDSGSMGYERIRTTYAKERDIQLIAMFRWETDGQYGQKYFCKIKCPVNPLPIKGEFECPTIRTVDSWLKNAGWSFKQKLYPRMFE